MTTTRNTIIRQGETHRIAFQFMRSIKLARPLLPGAIEIRVPKMTETLDAGLILTFTYGQQFIDLTIASDVDLADERIQIQPYTGTVQLPVGASAPTNPRILADLAWRGQVRKNYNDPAPLLEYSFNLIGGLNGIVQGEISASATAGADANAIFSDIPPNIQLDAAFPRPVWAAAYYWDWESVTPDGSVRRELQGRVWITREATK
jgi:hypothetical protein